MSDASIRRSGAECAAVSALAVLALGLAVRSAAAQGVVSTLDVGGATLRYGDSVSATAVTVSPTIRADWTRATLAASGTASQLGAGGWSMQGAVDASLFTLADGPLVGELAGRTGGSAHQDGTRTGQTLAVGRAHVMATRAGFWGGLGVGQSWDGTAWHAVRLAEAGAWAHVGVVTALAAVTPTAVQDTLRYTDAMLSLRFDLARTELGASAGLRSGRRLPALGGGARSWAGASATVWVAPSVGLVAAAGTYPVDLTQGFPGGRYATLSVRVGSRGAGRGAHAADRGAAERGHPSAPPSADRRILSFHVESGRGDRRALRVHAPEANAVEVCGDFTAWQTAALARGDDGWWTVTLPISRGAHQLNVRVDGGPWVVPPGLDPLADEFGGTVGLFVVDTVDK